MPPPLGWQFVPPQQLLSGPTGLPPPPPPPLPKHAESQENDGQTGPPCLDKPVLAQEGYKPFCNCQTLPPKPISPNHFGLPFETASRCLVDKSNFTIDIPWTHGALPQTTPPFRKMCCGLHCSPQIGKVRNGPTATSCGRVRGATLAAEEAIGNKRDFGRCWGLLCMWAVPTNRCNDRPVAGQSGEARGRRRGGEPLAIHHSPPPTRLL